MLDVHPPEHAAHTWRDFFIHIATIVVGLLIAIGLEQTVELFHHHHELVEARRQLAEERKLNLRALNENTVLLARMRQELNDDMALLLAARSGKPADLNSGLHYGWYGLAANTGSWESARQNNVLSLMGQQELVVYNYRYKILDVYMQSSLGFIQAMHAAAVVADRVKGPSPSPDDIAQLIVKTTDAQATLATMTQFHDITLRYAMQEGAEADSAPDPDPATRPVPDLPALR